MKYIEKKTLWHGGSFSGGIYEEEISKTLLVGEYPIVNFTNQESQFGYMDNAIYPAFINGKRAFLKKSDWYAIGEYSGSGKEEKILSFEEGVKLLLELGAYEHLFLKDD